MEEKTTDATKGDVEEKITGDDDSANSSGINAPLGSSATQKTPESKEQGDSSNATQDDESSQGRLDVKEENPQDATIEPSEVDFDVTVHDDTIENESGTPSESEGLVRAKSRRHLSMADRKRQKAKHGRTVRIDSKLPPVKPGLSLPANQYEVTLIRRAIRKKDETRDKIMVDGKDAENGDVDIYGDTSLGMKLSVVSAKVIVQSLNALADGRASPAQLAGLIKRGDVLLSINGASLVYLPIDQLMSRLSPMSTPDVNGVFQRRLVLRFEAGGGLDLLAKSEGSSTAKQVQSSTDPASDMFSLFPMVDQLSGAPLFEELPITAEVAPVAPVPEEKELSPTKEPSPLNKSAKKKVASANEKISLSLAALKRNDRDQSMSEFFMWSNIHSNLMRCDLSTSSTPSVASADKVLTKEQIVERGKRAIMGAMALAAQMEKVDSGRDNRSFRSWNTTLSLYSRASTRRRYVLDAASLPVNFGKLEEEKSDDESDIACASGSESSEEEQLDGDELLLRLAAHDEIWRKQVIEFLQGVANGSLDVPEENVVEEEPVENSLPEAMDFSSFLLGENISKMLTQRKKTQALPPAEVTTVLFDLTTALSAAVPDEVTAVGTRVSHHSSIVPFTGRKRPAPGSQVMLATQFLIEEALPVWTKTFRPLPWEQRRVLWPLDKQTRGESTTASTMSDDSLTIDSMSTSQYSSVSKQRKRKNLREQIEDQELDEETRAETCFLLTYYFTQAILPQLVGKGMNGVVELKDFAKRFGSYLKLHTCFAYAAALKAEPVIDMLLELARHDPKHREVIKHTSKTSSWLFYEPTMLSAVVQRLQGLRKENSQELRQATIDLCASAYPDVQAWQVQKQCRPFFKTDQENRELAELYYSYLSLLLHPMDGHESARRNRDLVKDWCDLSIQRLKSSNSQKRWTEYKANFFAVASRASSSHTAYRRDLVHLLQLSMDIDEVDLALDLAGEIIDHPDLSENQNALEQVITQLRVVGRQSLRPKGTLRAIPLKRVLKLFRKAAHSRSAVARRTFDVPNELLDFIRYNRSEMTQEGLTAEQLDLVTFLAEWAEPNDLLRALVCLNEVSGYHPKTLPIVRTLLRRAAHESVSSEMSISLMKVKHARMDIEENLERRAVLEESRHPAASASAIWQSMSNGMVTVAK